MDTPKTSDPAMSAASAGSSVIGNVSSLAGCEDTQFVGGNKTTQSNNSLIPADNIKSEFVDDLDDFFNLGDLKAEPADPRDIKEIQLGYLINASTPGDFSSETPAVKREPGLTNCLPLKVEPKVESGSHFQTSGHIQSLPKVINGEISDCMLESGQLAVPSATCSQRLSLFELMSQCEDQKFGVPDNMIQSNERKPVHLDPKRILLKASQTLPLSLSQSLEIDSHSRTLQQKQKNPNQCFRTSTVSKRDKESRPRSKEANKDAGLCPLGTDEDTDGYEMGSDSDLDVSQLERKNAGNQDGVVDFETEKEQTESVPTIPSQTKTNPLMSNKRGRKDKKVRRKQPKNTTDKNDEHILEQIPTNSATKLNAKSLNNNVINHTKTIQSFQNSSKRLVNGNNPSQQVNRGEKQLELEGAGSDSVKTKDTGKDTKSTKSRKIRKGKQHATSTLDATSTETALKRKVVEEGIRKKKRRKLQTEKSFTSNNDSRTESESNDTEVRRKNVQQLKKTEHKHYASTVSDSENGDIPGSESESQLDEPNSAKLNKDSRISATKEQQSRNESETDSEPEPPSSKQAGPSKSKSRNVRVGKKVRSRWASEVSDESKTGFESNNRLNKRYHDRYSGKRDRRRLASMGQTKDHSDTSESETDSESSNVSEQVSLGYKESINVHKQHKEKDLPSDSSEVGEVSSGWNLEEEFASDVRFQPFVQLEKLPDILEIEQLLLTTPVTGKVMNGFQTSNRKSNLPKKTAKTPDVVELVDIDDSASDVVGQSDDNEVTYEAQTPQVHDEELEFLTAAYYGINSSRARRLASMRLANYATSAARKSKKRETRSKDSSVVTLAENNEWEGSEVGDNLQSEETNYSQCGEKSQSNDTDNKIELDATPKPVSAKTKFVRKQVPAKGKFVRKYKRTTCKVCFKELASTVTYNRHFQSVHAGVKPFVCHFCGKGFGRKDGLQSHVTTVHNEERPCVCKLCGKTYKQVAHLQEHMIYAHGGKRKFICSYCGMGHISKYKLGIHVRSHTGEKPFECEICHERFAQKKSRESHYLVHSTEKPFICHQCGNGFKSKNALKSHLVSHSEVRNYKCDVCSLTFKCRGGLRYHILTHTDERNFKCTICDFAFRDKRHLTTHMFKHCDEKQFSCHICNKKLTYKKSIPIHMQSHLPVNERKFECDLCHKRFSTNGYLKQHKFLHTGKRPYACKICDQRFKTTCAASQHMMCVHPKEEIERRLVNASGWVRVDP